MNGMMVAGRTGGSSRWYWWKSQSLVLELAEVVDVVVEPQVDGERAMEEGIDEAGDGWKVGH